MKAKYKKVNCPICNQPAAMVAISVLGKIDIPIICIECGTKNGKKVKKKPSQTATAIYAKIKGGVRPDIHPTYFFRSPTEANFARILQYLGYEFAFEERVFPFANYERKPFQYLPDFQVTKGKKGKFKPGWFYEVKGYMSPKSRAILKRFKKNYPEEAAKTIIVIYRRSDRAAKEFCEKIGFEMMYYDELRKEFEPLIPTWE